MPGLGDSMASAWGAVKNFINPATPPPTNLFQTRVTRTPGGIAPMGPDTAGAYAHNIDPLAMIDAQPNLTPQEKLALKQSWANQGRGFITASPSDVQDPATLRHEQFHALVDKSGIAPQMGQIAPLVDPGMRNWVMSQPIYKKEAQYLGEGRVAGEEGAANDLFQPGSHNPELEKAIMGQLKTALQRKQFGQLTKK